VVAGGTATGVVFALKSCSGNTNPTPPPVEIGIEITEENAAPYLITEDKAIYYSGTNTIDVCGNMLDLKALSADNGGGLLFTIDGNIDFGLLVDPSMGDCEINGINNATVTLSHGVGEDGQLLGVLVGSLQPNPSPCRNLSIDKNVYFDITNNSGSGFTAYGVKLFETTLESIINIDATFNIKANLNNDIIYGVDCMGIIRKELNINGVFSLSGKNNVYGVHFISTAITENTIIKISGVFSLSSTSSSSYSAIGVDFSGNRIPLSANMSITGVFAFGGAGRVTGVEFTADVVNSVFLHSVFSTNTDSEVNFIVMNSKFANPQNTKIGGTFGGKAGKVTCLKDATSPFSDADLFESDNLFVCDSKTDLRSVTNGISNQNIKMKIFGTSDVDSCTASNVDDFRTYTKDTTIRMVTETSVTNGDFNITYNDNSDTLDSTKIRTKDALQNYINQPNCAEIGKK
jgi:hypothetical protein